MAAYQVVLKSKDESTLVFEDVTTPYEINGVSQPMFMRLSAYSSMKPYMTDIDCGNGDIEFTGLNAGNTYYACIYAKVTENGQSRVDTLSNVFTVTMDGANSTIATTFGQKPGSNAYALGVSTFKDFYIAVGEPGAYSKSMSYGSKPIAVYRDYGIYIKHAPLATMQKIKNVVVQTWKDEDGDDVFLPYVVENYVDTDGTTKTRKVPAVTHESEDYEATFVMFCMNGDEPIATTTVRSLVQAIEGRWLKLWDDYTQLGYDGAYLVDTDNDPKFKRRNYDYVEFNLKFKVNGVNIDTPFSGIS